jgi:MoxR-like ATPase
MSAITAALRQLDDVAADGDLVPDPLPTEPLVLEPPNDPIVLPDGKRIYPPTLHGEPVDTLALALLDMDDPARSSFLRLVGPPDAGKSQIARAIAYRLWSERGRTVEDRRGTPFYGFVEMQPGPSSDEFFFRHEWVPVAGAGGQVSLVDSAFVTAMREGWVVMIDEVNTARDVCLLSINATLDGRLALYLSATGETVIARPGFAVILAYNPGLVGATDIPDAWHSRFPATLEVTSHWPALAQLGAPAPLVREAAALDRQRIAGEDGLQWTPQFRDVESLWRMSERVGERAALAFFASNLHEQVQAGKLQDAEAAAACRMLDQAGYGRYRVRPSGGLPNLHGYPRAVTG